MNRFTWCPVLVCAGLIAPIMGCGKQGPLVDPDAEAKAKVEAIKKLADAMARGADGLDARAALEEFRLHPIDVQKNQQQADEILQIYRQRIQGRYRGEVAQEIQIEMTSMQGAGKAVK